MRMPAARQVDDEEVSEEDEDDDEVSDSEAARKQNKKRKTHNFIDDAAEEDDEEDEEVCSRVTALCALVHAVFVHCPDSAYVLRSADHITQKTEENPLPV